MTAKIRSTFISMIDLIETIKPKLRKEHVDAMKASPFNNLFLCAYHGQIEEEHVEKVVKHIVNILKCYDPTKQCFVFGDVEAMPNEVDFREILGIEDGKKKVEFGNRVVVTPFLQRQQVLLAAREKKARLAPNIVREQLFSKLDGSSETDIEDVARLITLYIIGTLVLTKDSSFMEWGLVELVDDYHHMQDYNWSTTILDETMHSLKHGKIQYGGCPMVIVYWICENSEIIPCVNADFWPRFRKWNLTALYKQLKADHVDVPTMLGSKWKECATTRTKNDCSPNVDMPPLDKVTKEDYIDSDSQEVDVLTQVQQDYEEEIDVINVEKLANSTGKQNAMMGDAAISTVVSENLVSENEEENEVINENIVVDTAYEDTNFTIPINEMEDEPSMKVNYDVSYKVLDLVEELEYDEEELVLFVIDNEDGAHKMVRELLRKHAEVRDVRAENLLLQTELEKMANELKSMREAAKVAQNEHLENNAYKMTTMRNKLRRIVQNSARKRTRKPLQKVPCLTESESVNGLMECHATGIKMNSMVKRLKNRQARLKKRLSGYKYESQRKKERTARAKKIVPVPCNLKSTTYFAQVNNKLGIKLLKDEDVMVISINEFRNDTVAELEHIKIEKGPRGTVWSSNITGVDVSVELSEELISCGYLNDSVINGRAELLEHINPKVKVIHAGCWSFIAESASNDESAKWYVDPPLCDFNDYDLMLFPINTSRLYENEGNTCQWTLLVFDLVTKEWRHYNSMLPAMTTEDIHLRNATVVKNYVENKIVEILEWDFSHTYEGIVFERTGDIVQIYETPQLEESMDSGVIVCIIMERLIRNKDPLVPIALDDVFRYRVMMTADFVVNGVIPSK